MNNIANLRKEKNLLQKDLAHLCNVTQASYSAWETGKANPELENLIKLADYFGCTIDYLIGRESEDGIVYTTVDRVLQEELTLIKIIRKFDSADKSILINLIQDIYEKRYKI